MADTGDTGYFNPNTIDTNTPDTWKGNNTTPYDGVETTAISKLSDIIKNGGYSKEQLDTMMAGTEAGLQPTIDAQKFDAKNDAYARGLGQSGVLSRDYATIDASKVAEMAKALGLYTQQGAAMVPDAIAAVQSGVASKEDLNAKYDSMKLDLQTQKNQFTQDIGLDQKASERFYAQLEATLSMSEADRKLAYDSLAQEYDLTTAQMAQAKKIADDDRLANFLGALFGSAVKIGSAFIPVPAVKG